jgi:hypothetical protein
MRSLATFLLDVVAGLCIIAAEKIGRAQDVDDAVEAAVEARQEMADFDFEEWGYELTWGESDA